MTVKVKLSSEEIENIQYAKRLLGHGWNSKLKSFIKDKIGKEYTTVYISDCLSKTPRAYSAVIVSCMLELANKNQAVIEKGFNAIREIKHERS